MYSLRRWIFRPKRSDNSKLAQFFYADEELNMIASELDSFDGRKDPERCTTLVNQLRLCQDKVLTIIESIMDEVAPEQRANRDFRVKFPDDVLQESLAGQLWFGAECLAAGSSIMGREVESASMRPLAKELTRHLDYLRTRLRDQCLKNLNSFSDKITEALVLFDKLFADFELSYVSAMVPVKTMKEYDMMQDVIVLFCETAERALKLGLLTQDMVDDCDPALMFTIPRLAIVCGLLVYPEGPLNPDLDPVSMSDMFRPFQTLLYKIRELLWTLNRQELWLLEKSLCSIEEPIISRDLTPDAETSDLTVTNSNHSDSGTDNTSVCQHTESSSGDDSEHCYLCPHLSDLGLMSHSPSTNTIISNPNFPNSTDQMDSAEALPSNDDRRSQLPEAAACVTSQESADSGMLIESERRAENAAVDMWRLVEARRLRHSQSWPETRRRVRRCPSNTQNETGDCVTSIDVLDDTAVGGNLHMRQTTSHEFSFHLPADTGKIRIAEVNMLGIADDRTADRLDTCPRIIFTNCSNSGSEGDDGDGPQISYVTDTFNEVFVTDTLFPDSLDRQDAISDDAIGANCSVSATHVQKAHHDTPDGVGDHLDTSFQETNQSIPLSRETDLTSGCENSIACDCEIATTGPSSHSEEDRARAAHHGTLAEVSAQVRSHLPICDNSNRGNLSLNNCANCDSLNTSVNETESRTGQGRRDLSHTDQTINTGISSGNVEISDRFEEKSDTEQLEKDVSPRTKTLDPSSKIKSQTVAPSGFGKSCSSKKASDARSLGSCEEKRSLACLSVPKIQNFKYPESVSPCSSQEARSTSPSIASIDWDRESYSSTETSSYTSDCYDDEEIALAIQAAELAARQEARSRFKSSGDLIHRLFVCISGVADQLQTNYASDLRHILKAVFECHASEPVVTLEAVENAAYIQQHRVRDDHSNASNVENLTGNTNTRSRSFVDEPPTWVPDEDSIQCTGCRAPFSFVRRRHHCRNCGMIFCGRCSSNNVPLPHYGHEKPVRVCNRCFVFQVTPFTVDER